MNRRSLLIHQTMMAQPGRWPCHPVLPLVRRRSDGGLDLGVLVDGKAVSALADKRMIVFRANLLSLPESLEDLRSLSREVFQSLDDLLTAGWRVD